MPFGCLCLIELSAPFVSSTYIMNLVSKIIFVCAYHFYQVNRLQYKSYIGVFLWEHGLLLLVK